MRIKCAGCDLVGDKGANFLAQLFGFRRQAHRIETNGGLHEVFLTVGAPGKWPGRR